MPRQLPRISRTTTATNHPPSMQGEQREQQRTRETAMLGAELAEDSEMGKCVLLYEMGMGCRGDQPPRPPFAVAYR
jgi:hypothetical protein